MGHIIDLLPTCADVAGAKYPETYNGNTILPVEGLTMLPIFEGNSRKGHDILYWEWSGNRAVREGKWKLSWDRKVKQWELYDLVADRTETNNLAKKHPQRADRLSQKWIAWAKETGVKISRKSKKK